MPKKIKVSLAILIFCVSCLLIGGIIALLSYYQLLEKIGDSFHNTFFLWDIIFCILLFYVILLVHESGHAMVFIFYKIPLRGLIVHMMGLKRKKHLVPFFDIKLWWFIGGVVIPQIKEINNDDNKKSYNQRRQVMKQSILAGPLTSIAGWLINIILSILFIIYLNSGVLIVFSVLSLLLHTIMLAIIIASSLAHNDNVTGDFPAYKKIKNDEAFFLKILYQYCDFDKDSDALILLKKSEELKDHKGGLIDQMPEPANLFYLIYYLILNNYQSDFYDKYLNDLLTIKRDFFNSEITYFIGGLWAFLYNYPLFMKILTYFTGANSPDALLFKKALESLQTHELFLNEFQLKVGIEKYFIDFPLILNNVWLKVFNTPAVKIELKKDS
ncbi:MAG: M50 family metallopeptidase [Acholeplasmatales bacterium]|jgi:hypothetical protein|nr:M50 family metallopeptidase [Acholeplasmatales bacterium]